jgi:hypothetical protein
MTQTRKLEYILLCGPIIGKKDIDSALFRRYQKKLKKEGIDTFNPLVIINEFHKKNLDLYKKSGNIDSGIWKTFMDVEGLFDSLIDFDAIYLIPGWENNVAGLLICSMASILGLTLVEHNSEGKLVYIDRINLSIDSKVGGLVSFGKEDTIRMEEAEEISVSNSPNNNNEGDPDFSNDNWSPLDDVGLWFEQQIKRKK